RLFLGEGVEPPNPAPGTPRGWIDCGFPMRGRERVVVRLPVRVPARGAYAIGPLRLRGGDWLGFTQTERTVAVAPEVIAYPAPLAVRDRALASLRPLAETATRRGLVPDPLRFRGVRPHRRGDARKEIHWKASARLGELQTKLYEPATSLDSIFLVNVASYDQYWIQADPESAELVVSAATELVRHAADAGRQVGLVTNGIDNLAHERPSPRAGGAPCRGLARFRSAYSSSRASSPSRSRSRACSRWRRRSREGAPRCRSSARWPPSPARRSSSSPLCVIPQPSGVAARSSWGPSSRASRSHTCSRPASWIS